MSEDDECLNCGGVGVIDTPGEDPVDCPACDGEGTHSAVERLVKEDKRRRLSEEAPCQREEGVMGESDPDAWEAFERRRWERELMGDDDGLTLLGRGVADTIARLTRERDEARSACHRYSQEVARLTRERDEARAQWDAAGEDSEALAAEVNRLRTQRNEARAEVERLRAGLREWYAAQVEAVGPDEATWAPHHGELAEMLPQHDRADLKGGDGDE